MGYYTELRPTHLGKPVVFLRDGFIGVGTLTAIRSECTQDTEWTSTYEVEWHCDNLGMVTSHLEEHELHPLMEGRYWHKESLVLMWDKMISDCNHKTAIIEKHCGPIEEESNENEEGAA